MSSNNSDDKPKGVTLTHEFMTSSKIEEVLQQRREQRRDKLRGPDQSIRKHRDTRMVLKPIVQIYLKNRWIKDPYLTAFMFQLGNAARVRSDARHGDGDDDNGNTTSAVPTTRSTRIFRRQHHLSLPMPCGWDSNCRYVIGNSGNCGRVAICSGIPYCFQHAMSEFRIRIIKTKNFDTTDTIRFIPCDQASSSPGCHGSVLKKGTTFLNFTLNLSKKAAKLAHIGSFGDLSSFLYRNVGFSAAEAQMLKTHNGHCNSSVLPHEGIDNSSGDSFQPEPIVLPRGLLGIVSLQYLCGLFHGGSGSGSGGGGSDDTGNVELIGIQSPNPIRKNGRTYHQFSVHVQTLRDISVGESLIATKYSGTLCLFRPYIKIPSDFYKNNNDDDDKDDEDEDDEDEDDDDKDEDGEYDDQPIVGMRRDRGETVNKRRHNPVKNYQGRQSDSKEQLFTRLTDGSLQSRIIWTVQRQRDGTPSAAHLKEFTNQVQPVKHELDTGDPNAAPPQ